MLILDIDLDVRRRCPSSTPISSAIPAVPSTDPHRPPSTERGAAPSSASFDCGRVHLHPSIDHAVGEAPARGRAG
jgi:hypothetical protein